jgi:hypothetical protein
MDPLYCTESMDRLPLELFKEGKAAFSGGRPYLVTHAQRLGLRLDVKPPPEYAAALGFVAPHEAHVIQVRPSDRSMPTRKIEKAPAKPRPKTAVVMVRRCELEIVQSPDGVHKSVEPVRIDLQRHAFKNNALVLGRDTRVTRVFSSNARISRRHCQLWLADGKVYVQDLASANKTFIDGVPLAPDVPYPLFRSQVLTMGAKHSAIKITLDAIGFPFMEKPVSAGVDMPRPGKMGQSDSSINGPKDVVKSPAPNRGDSTQTST